MITNIFNDESISEFSPVHRKSAVQCERLFSSSGYIANLAEGQLNPTGSELKSS